MLSERIITLKPKYIASGKNCKFSHFNYDFNYSALNMFNNLPLWEKSARSMAYAISNQDVFIEDYDTIGGRIFYNNEKEVEKYCVDLDYQKIVGKRLKDSIEDYDELRKNQLIVENSLGHITWRFDYILSMGIEGIKDKYLKALKNCNDEKSRQFYKGVLIMLDALLEFNDKHIEYYKKIGNYELAKRMERVPRYPCRTFKEAVQAFYMQHIVVMRENPYGGNGPGRLDYYLWPYLENDLKNNRCTLEEAKEIIDELFLRFEERLYDMDMWTEAIVVGGTNHEGNSAVNPLTYIMLESIMDLKIIHPAVYIRMPKEADEKLLDVAAKYLIFGCNRAQILNDNSIIESLIYNGVDFEDAINYTCGGCMEIVIQGKQSDLLYTGWQNTMKMLELMISGGKCLISGTMQKCFKATRGLESYSDFTSFYKDFINEANRLTTISLRQLDIYSEVLEEVRPAYLISSMLDNCFERGRNMHGGGVKYHDYGGTHLALPNLIDSLYALKYAVFDHKICSTKELLEAINNDFKGYENLQYKLKSIPKYGMNDENIDSFGNQVMSDFADMYLNYSTRHNGKGKPTILTFIHAPAASSILGASPDGLNAHHSIAQGITPNSNSMKEGITSAVNSCCKMPYKKFYGGASSMWDFDSSWIDENLIKVILKTFLLKKGLIFQGNTTPLDELLKAKENPEKYENLIVRVGGYSAKFINLWPELQDEIINRYRHRR